MCDDIPPNPHRQRLFELFEQNRHAISEVTAPFYQPRPGGVVEFVPSTDHSVNAAAEAKMQQLRDQLLEGIAQVVEESDPNAKDRVSEIRSRIGKAEQPERKVVKCWKNTEGKHKWRDTMIPGDASQRRSMFNVSTVDSLP